MRAVGDHTAVGGGPGTKAAGGGIAAESAVRFV